MGQSDTESTSSSMHGNPGSPRDPSILTEEVQAETSFSSLSRQAQAISPSTSSDSSELNNSVVLNGERPKSRQREIPVIDLTSPDHDGDDDRNVDMAAVDDHVT